MEQVTLSPRIDNVLREAETTMTDVLQSVPRSGAADAETKEADAETRRAELKEASDNLNGKTIRIEVVNPKGEKNACTKVINNALSHLGGVIFWVYETPNEQYPPSVVLNRELAARFFADRRVEYTENVYNRRRKKELIGFNRVKIEIIKE